MRLEELREKRENKKLIKERVQNILKREDSWNSAEGWLGDPKEYKITEKQTNLFQDEENSQYCRAEVEYYRQADKKKTRKLFLIDISGKGKVHEVDSSLPGYKDKFNPFGIANKGGQIAVAYEAHRRNPFPGEKRKEKIVKYVH